MKSRLKRIISTILFLSVLLLGIFPVSALEHSTKEEILNSTANKTQLNENGYKTYSQIAIATCNSSPKSNDL